MPPPRVLLSDTRQKPLELPGQLLETVMRDYAEEPTVESWNTLLPDPSAPPPAARYLMEALVGSAQRDEMLYVHADFGADELSARRSAVMRTMGGGAALLAAI